jgi:hypothetical protein
LDLPPALTHNEQPFAIFDIDGALIDIAPTPRFRVADEYFPPNDADSDSGNASPTLAFPVGRRSGTKMRRRQRMETPL